LKSTII